MQDFSTTPAAMVASIWRNRSLIHASVKREILGRYRGSILGLMWSIINPLLMLAVYTFVFSEVFKARWSAESNSKTEFSMILFAGLMIFNFFAECINRSPTLIVSNPNYVKKIIFPLEILPIVSLLSAAYHLLISLCVWLVAYLYLFGTPHPTALLLPLVILPFGLFVLGLSWILSSLGVFLRDISQIISMVAMFLMFLSPIFYPLSSIPEAYKHIFYFNPLTPALELTRDVLYWGNLPNLTTLGIYWIAASLIAWLGFIWFQKTRNGFADVL